MKNGDSRKGERAVTTLDIARHTGLSKMTVSRVLNEFPHVSEETRQKVMDAVRELKFRPNALAKRFFTGKTRLLGVVVPLEYVFNSFYFKELFQGILHEAEAKGYDILVHDSTSRLRPAYDKSLDLVQGKLAEGLLISAPMAIEDYPLRLASQNVPFVVMGETVCGDRVNRVTISNRAASADAVGRLVRQGHRRIAILTFSPEHVESEERFLGYRDALASAGIPFDESLVLPARYGRSLATEQVRKLLETRRDVTAIFAVNADMGLGAADALAAMRVRMPDDVSLVVFDDCTELEMLNPPVSAVRQFPRRIGAAACEMLVDLLAGGAAEAPRKRVIDTEFIERRSIGPAPADGRRA